VYRPGLAELAFAVQTGKGSGAAAATERVYLSGGTLPEALKPVMESQATSSQRVAPSAFVPNLRVGGEPEMFLRPNALGLLLYAVLGAKAVSGAGDPFTHSFTPANTQPWLTFWRMAGGILFEKFIDCKLSFLRISSRSGEPVRVSFGIVGISSLYRTTQEVSVAVEATGPAMHYHGRGALLVEGAAVTAIGAWMVRIESGAAFRDTLTAYDVRTGPRSSIEAVVEQRVADAVLWNRMVYGSASPANDAPATLAPLELAGSPAGLSLKMTLEAAPERSLKLDIPRVMLADLQGPGSFDVDHRSVRQSAIYRALKPAGAAITATLLNARAGY
jgi:hypothetical protein